MPRAIAVNGLPDDLFKDQPLTFRDRVALAVLLEAVGARLQRDGYRWMGKERMFLVVRKAFDTADEYERIRLGGDVWPTGEVWPEYDVNDVIVVD